VPTFAHRLKTAIFGAPIATDAARPVAIRTRVAIAVFGTGMISTAAYAPDAVLDALRGANLTSAMPWMAAGVVALMLLLGAAYRNNVRQRRDERADYGLVREKLGPSAGLVTGAALLVDYLFTVAVSVSALAHFAAYVLPISDNQKTMVGLLAIVVMTLLNLRGVHDRARVLIAVLVVFVAAIVVLLLVGMFAGPEIPAASAAQETSTWSVVIAFAGAIASGSVMMTGNRARRRLRPVPRGTSRRQGGSHAAHHCRDRGSRVLRAELARVAFLDQRLG